MPSELTPLTAREREVASLAAGGLSSDVIAQRLFVSVRTVDNHMQHVYQKLGIASRKELSAALGARGLEDASPRN
jgi:DNA-binding CsgD family transcriptional regulator